LGFLLVACLSPEDAPQVTDTPEATVTLLPASPTPELTSTPEPTSTPATETVTIGGVTMTVGEDGVVDMDSMKVEGKYTDEQKAEKMAVVDPTKWGYEAGETQIRVEGTTNRFLEVIDGEDVARVATWDFSSNQWLWDGTMMEHIPLFDGFAKTFPTYGDGDVRGTLEVQADAAEIRKNAPGATIYLYDGTDKTEAIIARYVGKDKLDPNAMLRSRKSEVVDGIICFMTKSGKVVKMKFKDIEIFIRGFN
jgi:hypothetical protein